MTGQVGAETRPDPPRSRWTGRPLLSVLIGLAVAALALGALWWFIAPETKETRPGAQRPESTAAPGAPTAERPRPTEGAGQQPVRALPPIPGTTVDAVAAGWTKRWGTPPKASARGYDTTATLPGTGYRTRFGVLRSADAVGAEVATLFCITTDERITRDGKLIRAIVDSCLGPALEADEKATLSSWLNEQDYSRDVGATREFPRFDAEVVSAGTAFQVRLLSKGRPVPGSAPATGAGPGG